MKTPEFKLANTPTYSNYSTGEAQAREITLDEVHVGTMYLERYSTTSDSMNIHIVEDASDPLRRALNVWFRNYRAQIRQKQNLEADKRLSDHQAGIKVDADAANNAFAKYQ